MIPFLLLASTASNSLPGHLEDGIVTAISAAILAGIVAIVRMFIHLRDGQMDSQNRQENTASDVSDLKVDLHKFVVGGEILTTLARVDQRTADTKVVLSDHENRIRSVESYQLDLYRRTGLPPQVPMVQVQAQYHDDKRDDDTPEIDL